MHILLPWTREKQQWWRGRKCAWIHPNCKTAAPLQEDWTTYETIKNSLLRFGLWHSVCPGNTEGRGWRLFCTRKCMIVESCDEAVMRLLCLIAFATYICYRSFWREYYCSQSWRKTRSQLVHHLDFPINANVLFASTSSNNTNLTVCIHIGQQLGLQGASRDVNWCRRMFEFRMARPEIRLESIIGPNTTWFENGTPSSHSNALFGFWPPRLEDTLQGIARTLSVTESRSNWWPANDAWIQTNNEWSPTLTWLAPSHLLHSQWRHQLAGKASHQYDD